MTPSLPARRRAERGQAVVILAVGGVAMLAMAGLALDAGFEVGRYRVAQNAADGAALEDANRIFSAEVRHAPVPSLAQLETTADSVIRANHAIPGRVSGGGGAGSGSGGGSGSSTSTTVSSTLPPVWVPGSRPQASSSLMSFDVSDSVTAAGITKVVTDRGNGIATVITATVPDPSVPTPVVGSSQVEVADNTVNESDNLVPLLPQSNSISCFVATIGGTTAPCSNAVPIPLPSPMTISDVATVNAQTPKAGTDAAGNPQLSALDDASSVSVATLGVASVSGDIRAESVVVANSATADVAVVSPRVAVSIPGALSLSLSIPSASIVDTVYPLGAAAYHQQQVACASGGSLTVTPAGQAPIVIPVPADCNVGALPAIPGVSVSLVAGSSDPLPGVACTLGVSCEASGCIEHLTVSVGAGAIAPGGASADVCLGRADAVSTLAASSSVGGSSGLGGSAYTPSSAADDGVSVDAYVDVPTFFLGVLGLTHTDPGATASAKVESVSDVADAEFTASPYVMPQFATRMDGSGGFERLTPGHEYYMWGDDMCADSPMPWCDTGDWHGRASAVVSGAHAVGEVLVAQNGGGAGPLAYSGGAGYWLMPVVDAAGRVAYYGEFRIDTSPGHAHWATLVNSDPALGGHLVQAPSTGAYNPYADGAATIRLTN